MYAGSQLGLLLSPTDQSDGADKSDGADRSDKSDKSDKSDGSDRPAFRHNSLNRKRLSMLNPRI